MTVKRTYQDSCGIARALDVVGERWALLVIRELLLGPKRFTDLRAGLPRIGPDMLAARLRELEHSGVVGQRTLPPPAARVVYELTEQGRELAPVLGALGRWGSRLPLGTAPPPLSPDAAVIAMQTQFSPAAEMPSETIAVWLDGHPFALRVAAGRLLAQAAADDTAQAVVKTDPATLAAVLWHGLGIDRAVAEGRLRIEGDELLAWSLLSRCM